MTQLTHIANLTSQGVAGVNLVRKSCIQESKTKHNWHSHDCPILFNFVTKGSMTLEVKTEAKNSSSDLAAGDSFVIPPGAKARYKGSEDLELLEVSLPSKFETYDL